MQVVLQPEHYHRANSPSQHEIHAVQSQGLLFPCSVQIGKGKAISPTLSLNVTFLLLFLIL